MGTPISSLPLASTPTGAEYVPIVQSGTTKRATVLEVAQTLLPITTSEISDANVTADKLAMDSVTTAKIVNANVTAEKLASGAALANIGTGGITATQLATNAVTTAKIVDANITASKLDGAQSGSAPIYAARAWVNFNGTGTVAIRSSGNVSSITDNGVGDYTINFATAMPDANYAVSGAWGPGSNYPNNAHGGIQTVSLQAASVRIRTLVSSATLDDSNNVNVVIFR